MSKKLAAEVKPARMQSEVNGAASANVLALSGFVSATFVK